MTYDLVLALAGFAFVMAITPGPNNLMLLASGVNFGVRRSVPHILGIGVGFTAMIVVIGLGLGGVFQAYPTLHAVLRIVGVAYLLWLAWKIARSGPVGDGSEAGSPFTFVQAALFQWVNPKAWITGIAVITTYTVPASYLLSVMLVAVVFCAINIPSISAWVVFGTVLRSFLNDPLRLRWFNFAMAALLVASLAPLLYQ